MKPAETHTGLLLERTLHLAPQKSRTIRFLYGYLPNGFTLDTLIAKYEKNAAVTVLQDSSRMWKQKGMRFDVPAEPWVKREATWNHYYLGAARPSTISLASTF